MAPQWIKQCTVLVAPVTSVGVYADDGSFNVVEVAGDTQVGLHHASGAYNVVQTSQEDHPTYHPSGALYILDTVFAAGV